MTGKLNNLQPINKGIIAGNAPGISMEPGGRDRRVPAAGSAEGGGNYYIAGYKAGGRLLVYSVLKFYFSYFNSCRWHVFQ